MKQLIIQKNFLKYILKVLKKTAILGYISTGEMTLIIRKKHILQTIFLIKTHSLCRFSTLSDICGVDYPTRKRRFEVVYHFLSLKFNSRIRLKTRVTEASIIRSIVSVFPGANWFEREAWDMFGIVFKGNPDIRRILTDYGFEGHPLRKDFPLSGFIETRYDETLKRVVSEPIELSQKYRCFNFKSQWAGVSNTLAHHTTNI